MADARVLVTGGSGFVGRQIVAALHALGADVIAPEMPRPDLLTPAARGDLLARTRPDTLVHAAWVTANGAYWGSEANLKWVCATLDLIRVFRATGGRRCVLIGSCAEYDWSRATRTPWRETRACRPNSLYGASKLATWTALEAFARQSGLSAATARVFVPVGLHEAPGRLLPSLIRAARDGRDIATGPAGLTRDFTDVRDVGEAVARVALSAVQGPVNIGAGRPVSLGDLVRLVPDAARVARLAGRPPRAGEPAWMVPDGNCLRSTTGFVPRFTPEATVADALAYWRAAG